MRKIIGFIMAMITMAATAYVADAVRAGGFRYSIIEYFDPTTIRAVAGLTAAAILGYTIVMKARPIKIKKRKEVRPYLIVKDGDIYRP